MSEYCNPHAHVSRVMTLTMPGSEDDSVWVVIHTQSPNKDLIGHMAVQGVIFKQLLSVGRLWFNYVVVIM